MWASDSTGQLRSETSTKFLAGLTPLAISGVEIWGNHVVKVWANPNQLGCATNGDEMDYCEGHKFSYKVQFGTSLEKTGKWTKAVTVNAYLNNWGGAELNVIEIPAPHTAILYSWIKLTGLASGGRTIRAATPVLYRIQLVQ